MFSNTLIAGIGLLVLCFLAFIPLTILTINFYKYGKHFIEKERNVWRMDSDICDSMHNAYIKCKFIFGERITINYLNFFRSKVF